MVYKMRIGIDIDDTICNTWDFIIPYLSKYFKISMDNLKNTDKAYYEACNCTFLEYCKFSKKYYSTISLKYKIKPNVRKVIKELRKEGHEIIFITARSINGFHDPYKSSLKYLDKHKIPFDKLIVNAKEKASVCLEEKIDLFIDDSIHNCMEVANKNIPVLLFNASFNQNCTLFKRVFSWKEIYKEVERMKSDG